MRYDYTNEDDPRVDRVPGERDSDSYHLVERGSVAPHDDAVLLQLSRAIAEHGNQVNDQARLIIAPLERDESLGMADLYEHVAGYVVMPLSDFLCGSENELQDKLAARLSVLPLADVDYDIVWGRKRTLALYVSAKLAT